MPIEAMNPNTAATLQLSPRALQDLRDSGLSDEFIDRMRLRSFVDPKHPEHLDDYIIPYFNPDGSIIHDYYRTKIFRPKEAAAATVSGSSKKPPKYIQTEGQGNRVYIPPNWFETFPHSSYIIITEGEKKAASLAQYGIPILGLGGVDSWRTKILEFPVDVAKMATSEEGDKVIRITLAESARGVMADLANDKGNVVIDEFYNIIKQCETAGIVVYVVFDTDQLPVHRDSLDPPKFGSKDPVLDSAFRLSMWLVQQGITDVRFVQLPTITDSAGRQCKTGLDDLIVNRGIDETKRIIFEGSHSFPTPGNIYGYVQKMLNKPKASRMDKISLAYAVIAQLDKLGRRFKTPYDEYYYFSEDAKSFGGIKTLMPVDLNLDLAQFKQSHFGAFLMIRWGLTAADDELIRNIQIFYKQLTHNIIAANPQRVTHANADTEAIYMQLNDGQIIKASKGSISLEDNGYDNVLFIRDQVEPIMIKDDEFPSLLQAELTRTTAMLKQVNSAGELRPTNRWLEAFKTTEIQPMPGMTLEETHMLLSAHFFLSPYFRRWKNLMLPIELVVGEPGSGKSLFYTLRKMILTGRSQLSRLPNDYRDWMADVINNDGFWVADNVGAMSKGLNQQYSDELARLVTDLTPVINLRKLYTTATNLRSPVTCTFAMTSINMPFQNEDIIQRSLVIAMRAIPFGKRHSSWLDQQMCEECGGRLGWILHHMIISARFFGVVKRDWDDSYVSYHRLMNYEQALLCMATALGFDQAKMKTVIRKLPAALQTTIASNNPIIEGLAAFGRYWWLEKEGGTHEEKMAEKSKPKRFTAQMVVDWALMSEEYSTVGRDLTEPRLLNRYMQAHSYDITQSTGIEQLGKTDNKATYGLKKEFYAHVVKEQ